VTTEYFEKSLSLQDDRLPSENLGQSRPKYVVITSPKGGLGDRFRGIVSAFFMAHIMGRDFLLVGEDFFGGDGFADYISPEGNPGSQFDWLRKNVTRLLEDTPVEQRQVVAHFSAHGTKRDAKLVLLNFDELDKAEVIEIVTNRMWIPNFGWKTDFPQRFLPRVCQTFDINERGRVWPTALQSLFRPGPRITPYLERARQEFLRPGTFKVAFHIRAGDSEMMNKNKPPSPFPTPYVRCFVERALAKWEEVRDSGEYPNGLVVYVVSDREANAKEAVRLLGSSGVAMVAFEGSVYVDHQPEHMNNRNGDQTRTFLDWWMLTEMDYLVATESGFSSSASRYKCKEIVTINRRYTGGPPPQSPEELESASANVTCSVFVHQGPQGLCQVTTSFKGFIS